MEQQPLAQVLVQHGQFVRTLAYGLLRDAHAAEDVAQETWARYLTRPPAQAGGLRAWLRTVVRNQAMNAGRSAGRRRARERLVAPPDHVEGAEAQLEQSELLRAVVEAVLALEEPYRETILARYWRGLDVSQVAAQCGASAATVRRREKQALETLRERLDRQSRGRRPAWAVALAKIAGPPAFPAGEPFVKSSSSAAQFAAVVGIAITCFFGLRWLVSTANGTPDAHIAGASASPPVQTFGTIADAPMALRSAEGSADSSRVSPTDTAAPGPAAAETYRVTGVLRHSDDGARMPRVAIAFHNDALSDPKSLPLTAQTDDNGQFSVDLPVGIFRADIPDVPDSLIFPKVSPIFAIPRDAQLGQLQFVDPDAWFELRCLAGGIPIGGVEIAGYIQAQHMVTSVRGQADQAGQLTLGFPDIGPGTRLGLIAFDHDKELMSLPLVVAHEPPAEPLALHLEPSGRVIVHARHANGAPAPNLEMIASSDQTSDWPEWFEWSSARTDSLGACVLPLPAGRYTLSVRDSEGLEINTRGQLPSIYMSGQGGVQIEGQFKVDWASEVKIDVILPDVPLAVSGTAVDERGAPLAGVHLEITWPQDIQNEYVYLGNPITDIAGVFKFYMAGSGVLHVTTEKNLLGDRFEPSSIDVPFGTRDILFRRIDSRPVVRVPIEVLIKNSQEHPKLVQPALFRPPGNHALATLVVDGLGVIEVSDYPDLFVQFRSVGFKTRTMPAIDLLRGTGIRQVELEPGLHAIMVATEPDEDYGPIAGVRLMEGLNCLAVSDANGRVVLDLDYWPQAVTWVAPGFEPLIWRTDEWMQFLDNAHVRLPRSGGQKR